MEGSEGLTMSHLWQHLEMKYPVKYKAVKDEQESGKGAKRQLTMAESIEKRRPFEFDHVRS